MGLWCPCDCWRVSFGLNLFRLLFIRVFFKLNICLPPPPLFNFLNYYSGPGGCVPYRIYVNVGIIFLCVVAFAPISPMVAPFSMMIFLFIVPMLKWSHIFVYRPTFDAGGMRWPILHDILMIAVIVAQVREKMTVNGHG
jgi:hypothetical protein